MHNIVDKSATFVSVSCLELFNNLHMWGTLSNVYDHVGDACFVQIEQLGGYTSFIHVWYK